MIAGTVERCIDEALEALSADPARIGAQHWAFELPLDGGRRLPAECRVADGWVLCDAPWPLPHRDRLDGLVMWGERSRSMAKPCLDDAGRARLRLEMPLADGDEDAGHPDERVRLALEQMALAAGAGSAPGSSAYGREAQADMCRICDLAGWPAAARTPDRALADLGVPGAYLQAAVERDATGVLASADIASREGAGGACLEAAARFLLLAAGRLRMAGAYLDQSETACTARLAIHLPGEPDAALLHHALNALSVGARRTAREAAVLMGADDIAAEYLARL